MGFKEPGCVYFKFTGAKIYGYSLKPEKKSLFNQSTYLKILKSNYFGDIGILKNFKSNCLKQNLTLYFI